MSDKPELLSVVAGPPQQPEQPKDLGEIERTYMFGDVTITQPVKIIPTSDGGHYVIDGAGVSYVITNWNAIRIVPRPKA